MSLPKRGCCDTAKGVLCSSCYADHVLVELGELIEFTKRVPVKSAHQESQKALVSLLGEARRIWACAVAVGVYGEKPEMCELLRRLA